MYAPYRITSGLRTILIVAVLAVAAIMGGLSLFPKASAEGTAKEIVKDCMNSGSDHSACYEAEVPALYPKLSVPQIFDIVRMIRQEDSSYQFCHVLGHKIGERVVAEDPNGWVNAIPLNPSDGLCSNGFIHGVVGGRFRSEVLDDTTTQKFLPDFILACQPHNGWQPSDLDRAICYHGMGHLFDFITNADLNKALDLCHAVAPDQYLRVCVQGVFMQIYQPLEPDDQVLIDQMPSKPTPTTVRAFCAAFKDPLYVGSCLEESWPFFRREITDGTGAGAFCSGQPNATETEQCYVSISSIIGRMSLGHSQEAAAACNNFPVAHQSTCFSYSAEAVLEESLEDGQKAIALCSMAAPNIANACLAQLADHAQFTFGANQAYHEQFCAALPSSLQDLCRGAR